MTDAEALAIVERILPAEGAFRREVDKQLKARRARPHVIADALG